MTNKLLCFAVLLAICNVAYSYDCAALLGTKSPLVYDLSALSPSNTSNWIVPSQLRYMPSNLTLNFCHNIQSIPSRSYNCQEQSSEYSCFCGDVANSTFQETVPGSQVLITMKPSNINPACASSHLINITCNETAGTGNIVGVSIDIYTSVVVNMESSLVCLSVCKPGEHSADGKTDCQPCAAGTYSTGWGALSCESCLAGSTSDAGSTSCYLCPVGHYNTQNASDSCAPCDDGYSTPSNLAGQTSCVICSEGSAAKNGSACTLCRVGTFANQNGTAECHNCDAGHSTTRVGQTQCDVVCPAGTYADGSGTACLACAAGYIAPQNTSASCTACDAGYSTNNFLGRTECSICRPGSIAAQSGSANCTLCEPGTYSGGNASTSCEACPPSYVSEKTGATECTRQCSYGHAPSDNRTVCSPCKPGYYQFAEKQDSCDPCPPGNFQPYEGSQNCQQCLSNQYSDEGATKCEYCGEHTHSAAGSKTCTYDNSILVAIIIPTVLVGTAVLAGGIWFVRSRIRRNRKAHATETTPLVYNN